MCLFRLCLLTTLLLLYSTQMPGVANNHFQSKSRNSKPVGAPPPKKVLQELTYHALLIYVQDYLQPSLRLDYPKSDVEKIYKVLTDHYQFDPKNVEILSNPDREALINTLDDYANDKTKMMTDNDSLLIFFAGHGELDWNTQEGYWLPRNAVREKQANKVSNEIIRNLIGSIKSRHTLLIVDSCYSGSLLRETPTSNGPPIGIDQLLRLPSRAAMTSGNGDEQVLDRNPFVDYLVKRLISNTEQFLPANKLFADLQVPVINQSPTNQVPNYQAIKGVGDKGGQFVFVRRKPVIGQKSKSRSVPKMSNLDAENDSRQTDSSDVKQNLQLLDKSPKLLRVNSNLPFSKTQFKWGMIANGKMNEKLGDSQIYTEVLGNGVSFEMVKIPAGSFIRNSIDDMTGIESYSKQTREFKIAEFLLGKYEVTQMVWNLVAKLPKVVIDLDVNPSNFTGQNLPVEKVSWEEAKEFIARLNKMIGLTDNNGYRLPREAEWEYAARGGTDTPFAFGDTIDTKYVNYNGNFPYGTGGKGEFRRRTIEVGWLGIANQFGLFDMHGNVSEWCNDSWQVSPNSEPMRLGHIDISVRHVVRGGSWRDKAVDCMSSAREFVVPSLRFSGFRLARTLP